MIYIYVCVEFNKLVRSQGIFEENSVCSTVTNSLTLRYSLKYFFAVAFTSFFSR